METIFIILLLGASLFYLIYAMRKQVKSHNCDDCGLMDMKKQHDAKNKGE